MMKIAVRSFALQVVCIGMSWSTLSAATYEKYSCEDDYFLDRSISDDGTQAIALRIGPSSRLTDQSGDDSGRGR